MRLSTVGSKDAIQAMAKRQIRYFLHPETCLFQCRSSLAEPLDVMFRCALRQSPFWTLGAGKRHGDRECFDADQRLVLFVLITVAVARAQRATLREMVVQVLRRGYCSNRFALSWSDVDEADLETLE